MSDVLSARLVQAVKTHLIEQVTLLTAHNTHLAIPDPRKYQQTLACWLWDAGDQRSGDHYDATQIRREMTIGLVLWVPVDRGDQSTDWMVKVRNTYDPIHAALEQLIDSPPTGAAEFYEQSRGLAIMPDKADEPSGAVCNSFWILEYERTRATTG